MRALALLALVVASPAFAQSADAVLAQAKADCAAIDNGVFAAPDAVTEVDLTGDGTPDQLIDSAKFQCSTSPSYWGGTGGNWLAVLAGGKEFDFLAQEWQVLSWNDRPVLLLWHNGGDCGGAGADPCVQALVWSDFRERFMTVAADQGQ